MVVTGGPGHRAPATARRPWLGRPGNNRTGPVYQFLCPPVPARIGAGRRSGTHPVGPETDVALVAEPSGGTTMKRTLLTLAAGIGIGACGTIAAPHDTAHDSVKVLAARDIAEKL